MKGVHAAAWPIIGLGAVAISSWLLFKDLRGLSLASLKSALFSISPARWLLAIGSTSLAYAALAWYDRIALLHLGRRINWRYVAVASFTAYALGHNIGASVLSGAVVRYRAYSEKGSASARSACWSRSAHSRLRLARRWLAAFACCFIPNWPSVSPARRSGSARAWRRRSSRRRASTSLAPCCIFLPSTSAVMSLSIRAPPIAARQLLAGPLELIGASGIIYFALPAAANPGFLVVLGVFVASFSVALASHAPGGLGVLEFIFLKAAPDAPQANVVAALLVFRLLYLILPLMFALLVVLGYERKRWRAPAAIRGIDPDGRGNPDH